MSSAAPAGTTYPIVTVDHHPTAQCQPELILAQELSGAELDRHISDCRFLMRLAQARFRGSHNPKDRAEADRWETLMLQAIRSRRSTDESTFGGQWALDLAKANVELVRKRRELEGKDA